MWFASWQTWYILNAYYFIHMLLYDQNVRAVRFKSLLKQINFYRLQLGRDMALIMVSFYGIHVTNWKMLYPQNFVVWVVFMEAIFSWLNLKPDETWSHRHLIDWVEFQLQQPGHFDCSILASSNYKKHINWENFGWNFSN